LLLLVYSLEYRMVDLQKLSPSPKEAW
jgi:hypothetical protein